MDRGILPFSAILGVFSYSHQFFKNFNTLSVNPTKWSNTLQEFVGNLPTNISSVFDHFVGLAVKGLTEILSQDNQQFFSLVIKLIQKWLWWCPKVRFCWHQIWWEFINKIENILRQSHKVTITSSKLQMLLPNYSKL